MFTGPNTITNGLVLSLDAANVKSYVNGSTTWRDLSGNRNNGTLTNGPTFDSANLGSIVFDGTNDYAEMSTRNTALEFQPLQLYSCFVFYKSPSTSASGAIIANMLGSGTYPGWDIVFNGGTTIAMHLISSWPTNAIKIAVTYDYTAYANQWVYFGYTYDGSCPTTVNTSLNSVNFYLNGTLYNIGKAIADSGDGFNTSSETITYNTSQRFRVASRWSSGAFIQGADKPTNMSAIQIYNRILSTQEILQNYEGLKSRYNPE